MIDATSFILNVTSELTAQ